MGRKISPVTERRRARRAVREQCRAEGKRVKAWVPAERKRIAGLIVQMRAHGQQQVAQLRAQTAELVKLERDQLGKRIRDARAAARLGKCVDLTAGPALHMFGPKRPPKGFRPPPPGSRAANPDAYDRRSRELVSEALEAQRRATAHAKEVARGFAYNPKHPDRPLRKPGAKKAGIRALKPKGKVAAKRSSAPPAKRSKRSSSSRSLPPAPDLALARQEREVRMYEADLARHARRSGAAPQSKAKSRKSAPPKPKPGKAPPDQYRVQYRGTVKLFKGRKAREQAQADAEFQSSRYAGTAIVSQRIGPGPNGWQVYDRWQGDKHSHRSSSDREHGRL